VYGDIEPLVDQCIRAALGSGASGVAYRKDGMKRREEEASI
jgi:hypothetical protein